MRNWQNWREAELSHCHWKLVHRLERALRKVEMESEEGKNFVEAVVTTAVRLGTSLSRFQQEWTRPRFRACRSCCT